ncbi:MAG: tetratricopeptide repeat protein [Acidobacteriota bacterium]
MRTSRRRAAEMMCAWMAAASLMGVSEGSAQEPAAAPAPPPRIAAVVEEGRRALEGRRYLEAVRLLTEATRLDPRHGEAHLLLGQAYWADDRSHPLSATRAADAFAAAVALDPSLATAWGRTALEQLAVATVRSERLDEARAAYMRLLEVETREERRARYLTQIDEIDLDRGVYEARAGTEYGPTGEIIGPIGPIRMRTNRWFEKGRHTQDPVKAEEYYRRAREADPVMWQASLNHGIAIAQQRRFTEALPILADAAAKWRAAFPDAPPHQRAHLWRLICFLALGRLDEAAGEVDVLTRLPDRDPWVAVYVLRYLVAAGRPEPALERLAGIAAENPESVEVLHALALAQHAVGRRDEAVRTLERALAVIPDGHLTLRYMVQPLSDLLANWRGSTP